MMSRSYRNSLGFIRSTSLYKHLCDQIWTWVSITPESMSFMFNECLAPFPCSYIWYNFGLSRMYIMFKMDLYIFNNVKVKGIVKTVPGASVVHTGFGFCPSVEASIFSACVTFSSRFVKISRNLFFHLNWNVYCATFTQHYWLEYSLHCLTIFFITYLH